MTCDVVSSVYSDSHDPIKVGDMIFVDDRQARVDGVFMPGSKEAEGCCCEDTGTLAVTFDDGIPVLLPFGNEHRIVKRH